MCELDLRIEPDAFEWATGARFAVLIGIDIGGTFFDIGGIEAWVCVLSIWWPSGGPWLTAKDSWPEWGGGIERLVFGTPVIDPCIELTFIVGWNDCDIDFELGPPLFTVVFENDCCVYGELIGFVPGKDGACWGALYWPLAAFPRLFFFLGEPVSNKNKTLE